MEPPLDTHEFGRWRTDADDALRGAEMHRAGGLYNWSCFLAEQAAQLAMKALLHGLGRAPWGHDLIELGATAREAQVDVESSVSDALHRLARHYIPTRYADAHPSGPASRRYTESDAGQALSDARAVLDFVDRNWKAFDA